MNHAALDFVGDAEADPRPFFLMLAHVAPHAAQTTGPGPCGVGGLPIPDGGKLGKWRERAAAQAALVRRAQRLRQAELDRDPAPPRPHAAGEPEARLALRERPAGDRRRRRRADRRASCASEGELDDTAIFFTSDNGYLFGEHRVFLNKVYPYEEALRVPLLARDARRRSTAASATARRAEVDDAGQQPRPHRDRSSTSPTPSPCTAAGDCRTLDGRSLLPLLRGRKPGWAKGRALLFQIGQNRTCGELPERGLRNFYDGVRTKRFVYVEHNRVNPETGRVRPARVRAVRPEEGPLRAREHRASTPRRAPPCAAPGRPRRPAGGPADLQRLTTAAKPSPRTPGRGAENMPAA